MAEEQPERIDPLSLFTEDIRPAVAGLTHLGSISETVNFCGHTFVMETIRPYMKYAIAQALEPYRNTLQEPNVYSALHVGVALTSVDGQIDFCPPVGANPREFVEARLRWITNETGWYQPTIDFLFAHYLVMEQKVGEALLELQNLSEGSLGTSQPSPGSSTGPEPSDDVTPSDILRSEFSS